MPKEKNEPGVSRRDDGFYSVEGASGYFDRDTANRVARQLADARKAQQAQQAQPHADDDTDDTDDADDADDDADDADDT